MASGDPGADVAIRYRADTSKARGEMIAFGRASRAASQQLKSSMAESRGAVKLLSEELGLNLNRQLTGFLAKLPGVAPLMAAAFPVAAVAGIGVALVDAGKRVAEWMQKQGELGVVIAQGFMKLHESWQISNDELTVTNDKLQEQISKLTGTHQNNLKLEIDELVVEADKLAKSLREDNRQVSDLLEKNQVGYFAQFMGQAGTKGITDVVNAHSRSVQSAADEQAQHVREFQAQIDKLGNSRDDEARKAKLAHDAKVQWDVDEKAKVDALKAAVVDLTAKWNGFDALQVRPGRGNKFGQFNAPDQTNNMIISGGAAQNFQDQLDRSRNDDMNLKLTARLQGLQTSLEEVRKAAEQQMKALEDGLVMDQQVHGKSADEEYSYWTKKIATVHALGDNYVAMLRKQNDAFDQMSREYQASLKSQAEAESAVFRQANAAYDKELRDKADLVRLDTELQLKRSRVDREDAGEQYQSTQQSTAAQLQIGQISPSQRIALLQQSLAAATAAKNASYQRDAELELRALGTYRQLLGEGSDEYQKILQESNGHLADALREQKRMQEEASKEMAALQREAMETGWRGVLADMARQAQDLDGQIKSMLSSSLSSANDTISKMLTGQYKRGDWTRTGQQIFGGIAKTGLQDAEGSLAGMFGLGKQFSKLGTKGNPMYTISADPVPGAIAGAGGALGTPGGSSALSGLPGFLSTVLPLAGFLADGGATPISGNYLVGERGIEVASFGSSARVHSNDDLRSALGLGGGDTHHHWNIDARGSHDPAAVDRAVQRGIAAAAPHIAAGAIAAQKNMRERRPSMAGS